MILKDRMAAMLVALSAAVPARVATRDLKDFGDRDRTELAAGIFTVISLGESGYPNYNGLEATFGHHRMLLVGQIELGEDALPSAIEDAEFDMAEEVKTFVRNLPPELCALVMTGFRQSGQLDAPYGWVSIDLETVD